MPRRLIALEYQVYAAIDGNMLAMELFINEF
jgi:hypothetical protein